MKEALKLSAVLNIALAILSYAITNIYIYPLLLIILAVIYLNCIDKENLNKTNMIVLALISILFNPLSGIILLVSTDKITNEKTETKKQEKQKIETPLNIGALLLCLSGIILATTNWEIMNNLTKTILIFFMGALFIILSILFEKKLNIKEVSKRYYIIGNIFLIIGIIANGYLEVTSHWFSFNGEGSNLYIAFTSIISALLSQISYRKYNQSIYKYLTYMGIVLSISFILIQLKISTELILIIVNIILLIINIRKQEKIKEYGKYLTYAVGIISIYVIGDSINKYEPIALGLITTTNLFLTTINKSTIEGIIGTILINITTLVTINNINIEYEIISIIIAIVYSIYYMLNIIKIENKTFIILMNIATNIVLGIYLLINIENNLVLVFIALLTTFTSLINYKEIKYENILLPIKITILGLSLVSLIDKDLLNINYILPALYLSALLVYLKTTEQTKKTSKIIFYILLAISILVNNSQIIPSIIGIVTALIFFMLEKNKTSYVVFLIAIFMSLTYTNILNTTTMINGVLLLFIYILLTLLTNENKKINKINYLSVILPIFIIISDKNCTQEIQKIMQNTIAMYLLLLLNIFILKNDKDRNIATTIISILIITRIMFTQSWMIGLYVGIIGLTMIIAGIIKKEYKAIYIAGIAITIINLIYQFKNILTELPLWLYLFLSGIIIITIVTYKAINEKNSK